MTGNFTDTGTITAFPFRASTIFAPPSRGQTDAAEKRKEAGHYSGLPTRTKRKLFAVQHHRRMRHRATHTKHCFRTPTTKTAYHAPDFPPVTSSGYMQPRDNIFLKRRKIPNVYAGETGVFGCFLRLPAYRQRGFNGRYDTHKCPTSGNHKTIGQPCFYDGQIRSGDSGGTGNPSQNDCLAHRRTYPRRTEEDDRRRIAERDRRRAAICRDKAISRRLWAVNVLEIKAANPGHKQAAQQAGKFIMSNVRVFQSRLGFYQRRNFHWPSEKFKKIRGFYGALSGGFYNLS